MTITPTQMEDLARRDPILGDAMSRTPPYPGFPTPVYRRNTHFHALARAIIYQQLATAAATTIYRRTSRLGTGGRFPTPARVLALSDDELRGAGLSRNKMKAIRDLAARVEDGRLPLRGIGERADAHIVEMLTEVWGVGEWSAQMFLMFRLGRLDIMPAGDLGVREGLRRLDGLAERPSPTETLTRAEVWRPFRSVAAWTLWRLSEGRG